MQQCKEEEQHRFLQQRSQVLLEESSCQEGPELCQGPFQILLEEELGILESGSKDGLIPSLCTMRQRFEESIALT